jgi:hypothetical protein
LDKECIDAYKGNKLTGRPDYASNHVSNFINSTIETIRPIMTDNNPRFQALARTIKGKELSSKIQMALDYEWDREKMRTKLPKTLLTSLQIGTGIFYLPWDSKKKEVKCIDVNPFNIFPDPMATNRDDAEYIIYAVYKNINVVKSMFPKKSSLLSGSGIAHDELVKNIPKVPVSNQILVLECWMRDYTYIDVEEHDSNTGLQVKKKKRAYPRGRVITVAPQFNVVLSDKQNPYRDGKFPFVFLKDYDIPHEFWGRGDVEQLLSPQFYINELNNAIIDNAKQTANVPWVIDKNSGIPYGGLSNRPGLVIRKNPGTEVSRPSPPAMPSYIQGKVDELKFDIETIAGVHDVTQGRNPSGISAAQAIMALQEAGQARIRLKVRIMEQALSELATMWYSRMQQFWTEDRFVRVTDSNGGYVMEEIKRDDLKNDFDVMITAGSTMPINKNALLDMMIRLSQTGAEDGLPMIDREALMEFVPLAGKQEVLERFEALREQQAGAQEEQRDAEMEQIMAVVEELTSQVEQLTKEHDKIKSEKRDAETFEKGYAQGQAGGDLTPEQKSGIIRGEGRIPDDIVESIDSLSDGELQQLVEAVPDLEQILANNS